MAGVRGEKTSVVVLGSYTNFRVHTAQEQFRITLKDFRYQNTEQLYLGVLNCSIDKKTWKIFPFFSWKEHCISVTWCSGCTSSYVT